MDKDKELLKAAINQAKKSLDSDGFPAGAVITQNNEIISKGISLGNIMHDPTEHSETSAIRKACSKLETTDLTDCTLYCALQPCVMCFSVAYWAGIKRIVYGCKKTDKMADKNYYEGLNSIEEINSKNNHQIILQCIEGFEKDCLALIREWENKNS